MNRSAAIAALRAHRPRLEALGVRHVFLFGSVARDAAVAGSDVDVMVDLDEGPDGRKPLFSAFDVGSIQFEIAEILGRRVDLVVRKDALNPQRRLQRATERLVDVF